MSRTIRSRISIRPTTLLVVALVVINCYGSCEWFPRAVHAAPQQGASRRTPTWQFGGFDPEQFFEQFFGQDSEEQQKKLAAIKISPAEEKRFGEQALQAFLQELRRKRITVLTRGREVAYLQGLVDELKPLMRNSRRYRKIKVLLADTPDTDARCFPCGTLVVFRGMLEIARSEATLVAVLGHEMSHIDHGHQLRHLKSMKLAQQTFAAPNGGMNFEQMMGNSMFLARAFARPFRPEQELDADADGVAWAYRRGYDPLEFAQLFLRMDQRDGKKGSQIPAFFRSHPYHRDRYHAIVAQLKELQRTDPRETLYIGQKNLRERVPRSKRKYDE